MTKRGEARVVSDGNDIFVAYDGRRIAQRGRPNTPQAGTWVSLEPGWTVTGGASGELTIAFDPPDPRGH